MPLTVLIHEWVTGGGLSGADLGSPWIVEGSLIRRTISEDFAANPARRTRVIMTLDARLADEPGPWETVRIGPGEEIERVNELASQADFTLIIAPETGGILQSWARRLEHLSIRSLGATAEAIGVAGDKICCAEVLAAAGIPTPPVRRVPPDDFLPRDAAYPAVLKPIDGAGSLATHYLESADASPIIEWRPGGWILQPYIAGDPMSASYLVDKAGGAHLLAIGRQRVVISDGRFDYRGGELPVIRSIDETPLRGSLAAIPGLLGFVGVDFIHDPQSGRVTVIEINPRTTTSCFGLTRILGPGLLARAWLASCGWSWPSPELFRQIADAISTARPVAFAADGHIVPIAAEDRC